jgi:hypothetical protein
MGRHGAAPGPPPEPRSVRWRRWALRGAEALVLALAAGFGGWAALTFVGTTTTTARWVGVAAGALAGAASWVGLGRPAEDASDEGPRLER